MITVVYHRNYHRLTVKGHAGSGETGHDLVCASASILAYTLAATVGNMQDAGQIRDVKVDLKSGDAAISCKVPHKFKSAVTLIFDSICGGFELLAENYPDNISYEIRG